MKIRKTPELTDKELDDFFDDFYNALACVKNEEKKAPLDQNRGSVVDAYPAQRLIKKYGVMNDFISMAKLVQDESTIRQIIEDVRITYGDAGVDDFGRLYHALKR